MIIDSHCHLDYSSLLDQLEDVIERASLLFDKVIVAVLEESNNKNIIFNQKERVSLVKDSIVSLENVKVKTFNGLLIKYAQSNDAIAIIRGLRAISDFEYEFQMALMNRSLNEKVSTVFLMPHQKYIHISSSLIKEVAGLRGDVSQYVPSHVVEILKDRYS